jgi:hypothetical protein
MASGCQRPGKRLASVDEPNTLTPRLTGTAGRDWPLSKLNLKATRQGSLAQAACVSDSVFCLGVLARPVGRTQAWTKDRRPIVRTRTLQAQAEPANQAQ